MTKLEQIGDDVVRITVRKRTIVSHTYKVYKSKSLDSPSFSEFAQQCVVRSNGEGQCVFAVVLRLVLQVLDDVSEQVRSLHTTPWSFIIQRNEVHMEVVVGWLVVQHHSQFRCRDAVALHDGLLLGVREHFKHILPRAGNCIPQNQQKQTRENKRVCPVYCPGIYSFNTLFNI